MLAHFYAVASVPRDAVAHWAFRSRLFAAFPCVNRFSRTTYGNGEPLPGSILQHVPVTSPQSRSRFPFQGFAMADSASRMPSRLSWWADLLLPPAITALLSAITDLPRKQSYRWKVRDSRTNRQEFVSIPPLMETAKRQNAVPDRRIDFMRRRGRWRDDGE